MEPEQDAVAGDEVDIEEIMREIREQILRQKAALTTEGRPLVALSGERFSPEFYEHLYHAALNHNQLTVQMHITKSRWPLLGPVLAWLRRQLHELVLFYVNQVAARQIETNHNLLQAINLMSQQLESESPSNHTPTTSQ